MCRCSGKAVFKVELDEEEEEGVPKTRKIEVSADEIEWETQVQDADRGMGAELVHIGSFEIEGAGNAQIFLYEYPQGCLNFTDYQYPVECIENFSITG